VDAEVKAGLLDLVDPAVGAGWSLRRACVLLEVNHVRVLAWRERLAAGVGLDDAAPGPTQAVHALLDRERDEIIAVYDDWHEIDRRFATSRSCDCHLRSGVEASTSTIGSRRWVAAIASPSRVWAVSRTRSSLTCAVQVSRSTTGGEGRGGVSHGDLTRLSGSATRFVRRPR
jgi:hypothetical protein